MTDDKIRQQLRQARRAQEITIRGLAKQLSVSASHLCDIEKGHRHPSSELAKKLKQVFPDVEVEKLIFSPCADRIAELEAEIQKLKEANRWIPVSERMPKQNAYYYCEVIDSTSVSRWYGSLYVMQQWWNGSDWNTPESAEVIAWRELPEPYQGGEDA